MFSHLFGPTMVGFFSVKWLLSSKLKLQMFLLLFVFSLSPHLQQSMFGSIIRNNLNRYLKNPLFTKSFVRNSPWPNEHDDHGSLSLVSPQNGQISEFIKTQNKFASDHLMEPSYGSNYHNFDLMSLNNEFPGIIAGGQQPPKHVPRPTAPKMVSPSVVNVIVAIPEPKSRPNTTFEDNSSKRANSKSLSVSDAKINAYSDSSKLKQFSKQHQFSLNNYKKPFENSNNNKYVDTPSVEPTLNENRNFETHLFSGNKYNQEKALNLKLEYGFRPLSAQQQTKPTDNFRKDFTVTNSIQLNDPFDSTLRTSTPTSSITMDLTNDLTKDGSLNDDIDNGNNNIYSSATNNKDNNADESLDSNRSMKALQLDALGSISGGNHLDEFGSSDLKKYISYPMETESSDIHKLAFTGMESFKPDHGGYVDSSVVMDNSLANYPHIKHFRSQGLDCARHSGYCDYDSSYPKEYVNTIASNCSDTIDDMYIEMPENLSDFSGYKSFIQVGRVATASTRHSNTSLCDSERKYIRPSVAQDVNGHFYLILQSSFYFQQVPVEICTKPGTACNVVGRCNSQVKCTQMYRTHMLISIDNWQSGHAHQHSSLSSGSKSSNCPKMRMYRLPSSCVCQLSAI